MKRKYKIGLGLTLIVLVCCGYFYYSYTKSYSINIAAKKTDINISSHELTSSFLNDKIKANDRFVEKTLEIVGNVKKITKVNNRYTILLHGQDSMSSVICDILPSGRSDVEALQQGQKVRLKGICKGFLKDVILLHCILINDQTDE